MTRSARTLLGTLAAVTFTATALTAAALAAIATLALLATPGSAFARCFEPAPIDEAVRTADVVIVGTVTAVAEEGTRATVHVEEIWRGPALAVEVVVWGGPGGRSSVDRTFVAGTRYLFTITIDADGRLGDSQCSSTTEWDPKLEMLRPVGMQVPGASGVLDAAAESETTLDPASLVVPAGVALLVAAALLVVGLLARGRQTNP